MAETFYLRIKSTKDGKVLLEATGISEVHAYNLIKLYGNRVELYREDKLCKDQTGEK